MLREPLVGSGPQRLSGVHRSSVPTRHDRVATKSQRTTDRGRHAPAKCAAAQERILARRCAVQEAAHIKGRGDRLINDWDIGTDRPYRLLGSNQWRGDRRVHLRRRQFRQVLPPRVLVVLGLAPECRIGRRVRGCCFREQWCQGAQTTPGCRPPPTAGSCRSGQDRARRPTSGTPHSRAARPDLPYRGW